jgi:hypothetical protein
MANQNNRRARLGLQTLQAYKKLNGPGYANEPIETALYDLLTDLMHWGSRRRRHGKYDKFERALETARGHFKAEEVDPS